MAQARCDITFTKRGDAGDLGAITCNLHLARHTCMTNLRHKIWCNHTQQPSEGRYKSTGLARAAGSWGRPGKLRVSSSEISRKMGIVLRFAKILSSNQPIEVDVYSNVQQRKWLEKSLHTLKTELTIPTVAEVNRSCHTSVRHCVDGAK